ncbi:MAG: hypothetical protein ACMXYD_04350, partial [Candidatus Woesearchaeota archaeon]
KISEDQNISTNTRLTIKTDGNVGIGDTDPSEKLSVTGNIAATGTVSGDECVFSVINTPQTFTVDAYRTESASGSGIRFEFDIENTSLREGATFMITAGATDAASNVVSNSQSGHFRGYVINRTGGTGGGGSMSVISSNLPTPSISIPSANTVRIDVTHTCTNGAPMAVHIVVLCVNTSSGHGISLSSVTNI